jgi:hypothetical protein
MGRDVPMNRTAIAGMFALLAACAWQGPAPLQTWPDVSASPEVVALDKAAWELVAIQKKEVKTTAEGHMHLAFELVNLSSKDLTVQVQTVFRNQSGMLTGDETSWQMLTLTGNGSKLYEVKSLSTTPGSYLVQVKTP